VILSEGDTNRLWNEPPGAPIAFPAVTTLAGRCFAMPAFATSHPFEQPGFKTAAPH
jgi:hypothetical protein